MIAKNISQEICLIDDFIYLKPQDIVLVVKELIVI